MSIWLGNVLWWNLSGTTDGMQEPTKVSLTDLQQWAKDLNMVLPSMPSPKSSHNFRAASGNLARRYVDDDGLQAELTTKEVTANPDFIVRHVVKTTTDPRTQDLSHTKVAELKFFRPTRTAQGRRPGSEVSKPSLKPGLSGIDADEVVALVEDFRTQFATRTAYVSDTALRRVLRDFVILKCDGILLRSAGGIYFAQERWTDDLMQLGKLTQRFGPGCYIHLMPLFDDTTQRAMISDALAEAILRDCRAIVAIGDEPTHVQLWMAQNTMTRLLRLQRHYGDLLGQTWTHAMSQPVSSGLRVSEALREAKESLAGTVARNVQGLGGPAVMRAMSQQAKLTGVAPVLG